MTKGGVSGASENVTICPKTGVWGVTQKSEVQTLIKLFFVFMVLIN